MNSTMEISEILDRVNRATGRFEREAVEAAIVRQDEITPELLQILEKLLRVLENAPEMYAHIDALGDYTAHLYAMFLLGEFGEPRAHRLLLRYAMLPAELLDFICGDFLDGGFGNALERTAESTWGIRSLIENRAANERVRVCALEALECLVRTGRLERAVVILYFRELFNGKLERTRSDLWDCLAGLALELEAPELLPEIRRAYEDGLLSPEMNIEEIEEYLYEADWEGFGSLISHAFSGAHRPALDLMTGKGWWTRSDREPRRSAKRKRDSA